jgi:hypothetical protein
VDTLLLAPDEMLQAFRARAGLETLTLADLLPASGRGTQPAVSGA